MPISLIVLLVTTACIAHSPIQSAQTGTGKWIQIDGETNPELIPDHVLWKHVFRYFAPGSRMPPDVAETLETKELPMSAPDYKLLREYSDKHAVALSAFIEPITKLQVAFTRTTNRQTRQKLIEELRMTELEQRHKTLELADAMLGRLSEDGRLKLLTWTNDFKSDISVTVLEKDLEFFQKPR